MARIDGITANAPTLEWAKSYGSYGVVRSLDVEDGQLLVGYELRGLPTQLLGAALDADSGDVNWAKVWDASNAGDNNNSLVARIVDGEAVIGGRIAIDPFDTQGGEGFLLRLGMDDGAYVAPLLGALVPGHRSDPGLSGRRRQRASRGLLAVRVRHQRRRAGDPPGCHGS